MSFLLQEFINAYRYDTLESPIKVYRHSELNLKNIYACNKFFNRSFWGLLFLQHSILILSKNIVGKPKIFFEVHVHGKPLLYDIQIISMCSYKQTIMEYIYNIELFFFFYYIVSSFLHFFHIEQMNIIINHEQSCLLVLIGFPIFD